MKKYIVELRNWGFDTSLEVEAESPSKAKGAYIKRYLAKYTREACVPRGNFFSQLSVCLAKF